MPSLPPNATGVAASQPAGTAARGEATGPLPQPGLPAASGSVLREPKKVGLAKPRYLKVAAPPYGLVVPRAEFAPDPEPKTKRPLKAKADEEEEQV